MALAALLGTIGFALGAGVATFFSPCSYALLPGYVGYYVASTGEETAPLGGALSRGGAAAGGAIAVFAVLSAVAIVAGAVLEATLPYLELGVGAGLVFLGVWILYGGSSPVHVLLPERRASVLGFGVIGAMYALAATACVLPLFLAFVFRSLTVPPVETALVLGAYAVGFAALVLSVTVATAVGYNLGAARVTGYTELFVRAAGVVLILSGFGQLYVAGL